MPTAAHSWAPSAAQGALHDPAQAPAWQIVPSVQTRPHCPQFLLSLEVSTHCPPHHAWRPAQEVPVAPGSPPSLPGSIAEGGPAELSPELPQLVDSTQIHAPMAHGTTRERRRDGSMGTSVGGRRLTRHRIGWRHMGVCRARRAGITPSRVPPQSTICTPTAPDAAGSFTHAAPAALSHSHPVAAASSWARSACRGRAVVPWAIDAGACSS